MNLAKWLYRHRPPLVMIAFEGERYLVSMLRADVDWVRNAKAAGGRVTRVTDVASRFASKSFPRIKRAPILKAYLQRAPGARPHVPVNKDAPLSEFEQVAAHFPVFRVVPESLAA